MSDYREWSWEESLAGTEADAGRDPLIRPILFDLIREHCPDLGLRVGETPGYRSHSPGQVVREGRS